MTDGSPSVSSKEDESEIRIDDIGCIIASI